jgi:hypothetical protein
MVCRNIREGGDSYEAFYVTQNCTLQQWMPSSVLGKTLNGPYTSSRCLSPRGFTPLPKVDFLIPSWLTENDWCSNSQFDGVFVSFLPPASLETKRTQSWNVFSFAVERTANEKSSILIEPKKLTRLNLRRRAAKRHLTGRALTPQLNLE